MKIIISLILLTFTLSSCKGLIKSKQAPSHHYIITLNGKNSKESQSQLSQYLEQMSSEQIEKKPIEITYQKMEIVPVVEEEQYNSNTSKELLSIKSSNSQLEESDKKEQGTIYFMWGNLEDDGTKYEWGRMFSVIRWLSKNGFKVIVNPYSLISDVEKALKDHSIKIFIWSGHGDHGILNDKKLQPLPENIFFNTSPTLRQIIFSSCDGEQIVENYRISNSITPYYWRGKTNSKEFIDYLLSANWAKSISEDLNIQIE